MTINTKEVGDLAIRLQGRLDHYPAPREVYNSVADAAVQLMLMAIEYEDQLPEGVSHEGLREMITERTTGIK